jgi:hypothetical protein
LLLILCGALLLALALTGCDPTLQATAVIVFPTPVAPGSLPTFNPGGGGFPIAPTPVTFPTLAPVIPTAPAQPTAVPVITFSQLRQGVEWASTSYRASNGATVNVLIARLDPAWVSFRVHYLPGQARGIRDWQVALPGAIAIVNGSFFTPENNALGVLFADGIPYGAPTSRNDAGMFQVSGSQARVRSNWLEPVQAGERPEQAVQTWPILIASQGNIVGAVAPLNPDMTQVNATRTVVAQDQQGRILFMVTPFSSTTLPDLGNWLGASGLGLTFALNLDGGTSTNMFLATGGPSQWTQGLRGIPVVIAAYPR